MKCRECKHEFRQVETKTFVKCPACGKTVTENTSLYWAEMDELVGLIIRETYQITDIDQYGDYSIDLKIPKGIKELENGDFSGWGWCIKSVSIPSGLKSIGINMFRDLSDMERIRLPSGLKEIGAEAFSCCFNLKRVTIPRGTELIEDGAFYCCIGLKKLTLPDGIVKIGKKAFARCTGLQSVSLPDSLRTIGDEAFAECRELCEITIPAGVTSIGAGAFRDCKELRKATITASITEIPENMFHNCRELREVSLPDGLRSIGGGAFALCPCLSSIKLPDSVESVGEKAFLGNRPDQWSGYFCGENLEWINLHENVTYIADDAFDYCKLDEFAAICKEGSYAHKYCVARELPVILYK